MTVERKPRVLLLEDDPDDAVLLRRALVGAGLETELLHVEAEAGYRAALAASEWDVVISDFALPGFAGERALDLARSRDIPVIFVSGAIGEERAIDTLKAGASDCILKSNLSRLAPAIRRALEERDHRRGRDVAEQALRGERERYAAIFRSNPTGQLQVDIRRAWALIAGDLGPHDARVTSLAPSESRLRAAVREVVVSQANPAALALLGASSLDDLSQRKSGLDVLWRAIFRELLAGKSEVQVEVLFDDLGDRAVAALVFAAVPNETASLARLVVSIVDVTERQRLERQLRAAQRMEAVGRLASGVAHDFNNLLSVILSYAGFAIDALPEGDAVREDVQVIQDSAERAAVLVSQLLAFSRRQHQQLEVLNLNDIVGELERMLARIIGEDVELLVRRDPRLELVRADHAQIDQVIMNLVVNARDAMPEGGRLVIETANVDLDAMYSERKRASVPPGRYAMLAVSDTGIGIDDHVREQMFEPFFTTKPGKGTGLGLATVYGIVKQSNGFVWAYSEPGRGTTFKVYLPCAQEEATASGRRKAIKEVELRGTETILLVEDDALVRRGARRILTHRGYTVIEAGSGHEALDRLAAGARPSLLLTDLVMPNMTGRELARRVRELLPEIGLVFMSGYADHAAVEQGLLEPGAEFVQKPVSAEVLLRKIRAALDSKGDEESKTPS